MVPALLLSHSQIAETNLSQIRRRTRLSRPILYSVTLKYLNTSAQIHNYVYHLNSRRKIIISYTVFVVQ